MELKSYQQGVITDLKKFLHTYHYEENISKAYEKHWAEKGVGILSTENLKGIKAYQKNIGDTPHVCVKVPTAGGKTFIAVNARYDFR